MDGTDRRDPRDHRAPLYDARFEHDACGVGFVADAGGRSGGRVLPLALAGLAALAHRGAFAADGESSDGAGVALPLSPSLRSLIAGPLADARPAVVMLFLPRGRSAARAARDLVERTFADVGPADRGVAVRAASSRMRSGRWRRPLARSSSRRSSRARTARRTSPSSDDWSSRGGGSRRPPDPWGARSASCRSRPRRASPSCTRDWSPARGWPSCTRISARRSMSRTRSSTSATPRTRRRSGGSPSRSGRSPTTARSTRCAATASRCAVARVTAARAGSRPSCSTPGRCSRRMARIRCRSTRGSSS